jgi:hypothetical protein
MAVRTLGGVAALATASRLGLAPAAARDCLTNGAACDPASAADCCTGACKKHKGKFKCAPAGSAQGCTKALNSCTGAMALCPDASGPFGQCVNGKKGKPLCYSVGACIACKHDADCVGSLGLAARCIKGCPLCLSMEGVNSACVLPVPSP